MQLMDIKFNESWNIPYEFLKLGVTKMKVNIKVKGKICVTKTILKPKTHIDFFFFQ